MSCYCLSSVQQGANKRRLPTDKKRRVGDFSVIFFSVTFHLATISFHKALFLFFCYHIIIEYCIYQFINRSNELLLLSLLLNVGLSYNCMIYNEFLLVKLTLFCIFFNLNIVSL